MTIASLITSGRATFAPHRVAAIKTRVVAKRTFVFIFMVGCLSYLLITCGISTFRQSLSLTGLPSVVRKVTLFMVQSRARSIVPASLASAVTLVHLTFLIGFSGSPVAEKTRRAPTTVTSSIVMLRNSHRPRSGGRTGVLSVVQ